MAKRTSQQIARQARERIAAIRHDLTEIDLLCSGTLSRRMMTCGSPGCRCADDPNARHGPYYEWAHMKAGKQVHRLVAPEQAPALGQAIGNYRKLRKLLRSWEAESERLIDAEVPRTP